MTEEDLMRKKLVELFLSKAFVHIVFNSRFHYNGWLLQVSGDCIEFRDKKSDEVMVLKIKDISLAEEEKDG